MIDRNHPWRRSMRAIGGTFPESAQAGKEARIDKRVRDLLTRLGPLSSRDLGRRLKCIQEGSGSMTRWRLPGTERKDET